MGVSPWLLLAAAVAIGTCNAVRGIPRPARALAPRLSPLRCRMTEGSFAALPPAADDDEGGENGGERVTRVSLDGTKVPIGMVSRRTMSLSYTCNVCEERNVDMINRDAYTKGLVIVTCKGCDSHHLIADHLAWVNPGFGSLEDYMSTREDQKIIKFKDADSGYQATWITEASAEDDL
ncbi:DNL zinc finger-domain-containing protein [Pavlovales sp. CCMP2436]|nr:DNL zinc finger-domain-containing protein [Pavlovales sp. CCMP2436]|mmetsp:Transcript_26140/g.66382  ORF Transcript_26140/g.66382 Transcript_26140/m.66382 type:complete len:178 (-) Transcript_26140:176-709(-)